MRARAAPGKTRGRLPRRWEDVAEEDRRAVPPGFSESVGTSFNDFPNRDS